MVYEIYKVGIPVILHNLTMYFFEVVLQLMQAIQILQEFILCI